MTSCAESSELAAIDPDLLERGDRLVIFEQVGVDLGAHRQESLAAQGALAVHGEVLALALAVGGSVGFEDGPGGAVGFEIVEESLPVEEGGVDVVGEVEEVGVACAAA